MNEQIILAVGTALGKGRGERGFTTEELADFLSGLGKR